jgi:ABC-2 type transport system permease protein
MFPVFRHSLTRMLGQILGWGISLALLGVYGILLYDSLVKPGTQQQFEQLLSNYPPELMTFFGDMSQIFSPSGYLNTLFFTYIPIVIGIFSIMGCTALLVGDEEKGILDLVLAHPISRTALFIGRLGAFTVATLLILFIAWLGFVLPLPKTTLDATPWEMILPFLSLFALLMFVGTLALLLSMVFPSQQWAAMTAGLVLVASYFLTSFVRLSDKLKGIEKFFPMHYYQGGLALKAMNWGWFALLIGFSVLFAMLTWWVFERRDIRVSGEGGWRVSAFLGQKAAKPESST